MKIELKVVDRKKKDVTYYDSLSGTAKCVPSYVVYHLKLIRYLGCKCYIVLGCSRKDLYPPPTEEIGNIPLPLSGHPIQI